jgi:hypothetical protein
VVVSPFAWTVRHTDKKANRQKRCTFMNKSANRHVSTQAGRCVHTDMCAQLHAH